MSGDWNSLAAGKRTHLAIIVGLIAIGVVMRIMPHPPNFAPITALALFGGAVLPKRTGLWLPLAAMVMSDLIIGLHPLIPVTWGTFLLIALFAGKQLRGRLNTGSILASSLGSSLFFFAASNLAVWAEGALYPRTLAGLSDTFVQALPFFRNTLLGDLFFAGMFFGAYYLALQVVMRSHSQPVQST